MARRHSADDTMLNDIGAQLIEELFSVGALPDSNDMINNLKHIVVERADGTKVDPSPRRGIERDLPNAQVVLLVFAARYQGCAVDRPCGRLRD